MPRRRRPRRGVTFGVVVLVLTVLGLAASYFLWRHGQRAQASRNAEAARRWASIRVSPVLPEARLASPVTVAILRDPASDRWFNGPATLDTVVRAWEASLAAVGARVRVLGPAGVAQGDGVDVVLVPSSPCLGASARAAVDRALARGLGVITTWLTGTRDGQCGDAGYHFLTTLTGASRIDTLGSRPMVHVTFPDGGALASGLPPGATLQVRGAHDGALRVRERDAYYSDGMLNPAPAGDRAMVDAAVAHTSRGRGRVVYWGFDVSRVADRPWDREVARLLVRNSVAWAAGEPLASLAPWPDGRAAALVLLQDVAESGADARRALDTLRDAGLAGTHFVATRFANGERAMVRDLASHGEVASRPDDELRIARTDEEQANRFRDMRDELAGLLGRPVDGMVAPLERLDPAVALAWVNAGGKYIVAGNDMRSASPELLSVEGKPLVLLPRLADDDAAVVQAGGGVRPEALVASYAASRRKLRAIGGLHLLRYHSRILARPDLIPALARTARAAAADSGMWTATASDVAAWWLARASADVAAVTTDSGVELRVRNGAAVPLSRAVARVAILPGRTVGSVEGATLAENADGTVNLALPDIAPGVTHVVRVRLAGSGRPDAR